MRTLAASTVYKQRERPAGPVYGGTPTIVSRTPTIVQYRIIPKPLQQRPLLSVTVKLYRQLSPPKSQEGQYETPCNSQYRTYRHAAVTACAIHLPLRSGRTHLSHNAAARATHPQKARPNAENRDMFWTLLLQASDRSTTISTIGVSTFFAVYDISSVSCVSCVSCARKSRILQIPAGTHVRKRAVSYTQIVPDRTC